MEATKSKPPATTDEPTVFVVDDEPAVRESLQWLVRSVGLAVETYASAHEFLDRFDANRTGCLVLDIRMPDMSGIELQEELLARKAVIPVIFITGFGEVTTAVRALKMGALDFLEKPFSDQVLLDRIRRAVEKDKRTREYRAAAANAAARLASLTRREREVIDLVVAGKSNRAIAAGLNISEKTVEFHRANVMNKLGVDSLAELLRVILQTRGTA